ncbi:ABC transporter ATP-binding protein [Culicoidibacter larvae]|uniref:ABC transporter ATP-binding protein n=1 Tax=Culicoidibacter larvae TaxID=2579976 RepID=A0A5R8QEZ8_9FIRM|nr:ABC transporter ATP-binding protein [Culicoidibacter larvae]TLG76578.1 ABC transporter ATP-binding protein [Culicoidibacter larvae]
MKVIVDVDGVVKRYNNVAALKKFSIQVREGEIYGLLGPNGAGKTTAINAILGLLSIDSGSIKIFDKELKGNEAAIKKQVGVIPQQVAVFRDLTVQENIDFFAQLYKVAASNRKQYVADAIAFTGLEAYSKKRAKELSGGLQRRLNIACGIVHKPRLIFMDEPTVAIDPQSRNSILEGIIRLRDEGATIVYTSHYMEEVEAICDYIAIVDNGYIIAQGSKEALKDMVSDKEAIRIIADNLNETVFKELRLLALVEDVTHEAEVLTISIQKNADVLNKVITILQAHGVEIHSINVETPTLNTVFLTLTGKQLRD